MKKNQLLSTFEICFVQRYSNLKTMKKMSLNCEEPLFYSSI